MFSLIRDLANYMSEYPDPSRFFLVALFMSFIPSPFFGRLGMSNGHEWHELSKSDKSFAIVVRTALSALLGLVLAACILWFGFAPVGFTITILGTIGFGFWIVFWAKHTEINNSIKSLFSLLNINKRLELLRKKREEEIRMAEAQLEAMRRADPILREAEREVAAICSTLEQKIDPYPQVVDVATGRIHDYDGSILPNPAQTVVSDWYRNKHLKSTWP